MFYIGLILLLLGVVVVYRYDKLSIKGGGFITAVIGIILLLFSNFPSELEFLRVFKKFLN